MKTIMKRNQKLSGAAEARRAHNPEDTGSKPVSANSSFLHFLHGPMLAYI
jgi:hypothetical protein